MKKVLVTGAAGFIGSRVCEMLASEGMAIVAADNFDPYYDIRLKHYRWEQLAALENIQLIELDICDEAKLDALFAEHAFDAVVNMAAMAGVRFSIENPKKYFRVNASGFLGLLETMKAHGVRQIVQASTSSLYAGLPMPFKESLDVRTPISPYAASKLGAEALGYTYSSLHGFDVTVLRYFTVYGPAGRPDMAPFRFTEWCLRGETIQLFGDGKQSRDFTYVDDIARGTVLALKKRLPGFEIINLGGGGDRTTILDTIQMIAEKSGCAAKIDFLPVAQGDMLHTSANIEKARRMLEWTPEISLNKGIAEMTNHHRSYHQLYSKLNF
jgi:nucleoside-diphosphate-sugar epimerase